MISRVALAEGHEGIVLVYPVAALSAVIADRLLARVTLRRDVPSRP